MIKIIMYFSCSTTLRLSSPFIIILFIIQDVSCACFLLVRKQNRIMFTNYADSSDSPLASSWKINHSSILAYDAQKKTTQK